MTKMRTETLCAVFFQRKFLISVAFSNTKHGLDLLC